MHSNLPTIGFLLGLISLCIGTLCLRYAWSRMPGTRLRAIPAVLGLACSVAVSVLGDYRPGPDEHIMGFPFLSMAFLRRKGLWLDYLGPFTILALVANAYVGFTLPFIVYASWLLARRRR
jgi:hypothetical protein